MWWLWYAKSGTKIISIKYMERLVIDTCVLARAFLDTREKEYVQKLILLAIHGRVKLYAPTVVWDEMYAMIMRNYREADDALKAFRLFEGMIERGIIELVDQAALVDKATELSFIEPPHRQDYIDPPDAMFHATALKVGGTLLTTSKRNYYKAMDIVGSVTLFEDYEFPDLP